MVIKFIFGAVIAIGMLFAFNIESPGTLSAHVPGETNGCTLSPDSYGSWSFLHAT